ncbi:tandem-95 repeat protein [Ascidiaceihabitans sp.]|nr:tandem-95 repeat protein [Ascidiaceihabitans sp.]
MRNFEMKPDKSNYDMHLGNLQKRFDKKLKLSGSKSLLSLMALGLSGCGASTVGQFTSSGTGYKGPLSNATVFIDLDDDGILDSGEISTLTDVDGKFSFSTDDESLLQGNIILTTNENTVDASSGEQLSGLTLKATNGSDVVSPATTLIKQLVDGGDSLEQAETTVQAALGIDEDIDLSTFNPFETTNLEAAKEVEAAAQKIVAIVNTVSSAAEAGGADKELALEAALGTIAEAIDGSTGSLNLSDTSATGLISKVITAVDAATGTSTDTTLVNAIANVNEAIDTVVENAETLDDARETFSIAQSTLLDAAEATANGDTYIATQLGSTSDATQLISIAEEAISAKGTKGFVNESDEPITLSGVITLSDPDATDGIEYRVKEGSASPVGSGNILGGTLMVGADGEWTYKLDVTTDADKMALLQELQSKEFKGDLTKSDISPSLNNFQIVEKFEVQIEKVDTISELETPSVSDALYRDGSTITKVITVVINGDNDAVVSTETKISDLEDVSQGIAIADIDTSKFFSDKEVDAVSSSGGASGDGDVLLFSASGLPEGLILNAETGVISGTPSSNTLGVYEVVVTATDIASATASQSFKITIVNVNDTPVVTTDIADTITDEDDLFTLDISSAFDDADIQFNGVLESDEILTFSATLADGSELPNWISLNSSTGVFTGTPSNNDVDNLELTVTATDVSLASVTNNFTITVSNTNDVPTASTKTGDTIGDFNSINIDASYLAAEIADVDAPYGDTLTVTNVSVQSGGGNVAETSVGSGVWTYTPPDVSNDTAVVLEYTVSDELGANATADIELNVVDALPIGSINEDGVIDIDDMLAAAADVLKVDVSDLSIALASDPDTNLAEGSSYAPAQDINGAIKFVIKQVDADNLPAVLEIKAVDDAAVVNGDISKSDAEDKVISGTLSGNDVADGLSDGTLWTVASDASNGAASIDAATGEWSYTPTANFNGTDKFTVTLTDDDGHTLNQDVSVTVSAVDDPAVITGETAKTGDEDNNISGTLSGTDAADGLIDGTLWTVESDASNGAASINAATGEWSYTPTANFNGADKFTVTLTDDDGHTLNQDVSITVSAVDDAAVITGETAKTGDEDNDISGTLSGTDTADGLSDGTLWTVANDASNGAASINAATGEWSYTPTANFNGTDKFTVTLTDDDGNTSNQDVSVTVLAVDDAAVITGDTTGSGTQYSTDIKGQLEALDPEGLTDGSYFSVSTDAKNGAAAIDAETGEWTYTPTLGAEGGLDQFVVTVTDDLDGVFATTIDINIATLDNAITASVRELSGIEFGGETGVTATDYLTDTYYAIDLNIDIEAYDMLTDVSTVMVTLDHGYSSTPFEAISSKGIFEASPGAQGVTVLYDSSEASEDLGTFIFSNLNKAIVSNDSPFTGPSSELGTIYLNLDDSLTNASVILDELAVVETDAGSLGNLILASISVDLI